MASWKTGPAAPSIARKHNPADGRHCGSGHDHIHGHPRACLDRRRAHWPMTNPGVPRASIHTFARKATVVGMLGDVSVAPEEGPGKASRHFVSSQIQSRGLCSPPSQVALQASQPLQALSTQSTFGPSRPRRRERERERATPKRKKREKRPETRQGPGSRWAGPRLLLGCTLRPPAGCPDLTN